MNAQISKIKAYTYLDIEMCNKLMEIVNTGEDENLDLNALMCNFWSILSSNDLATIYRLNETNYRIFDWFWMNMHDFNIPEEMLNKWEFRLLEIYELSEVNQLVTI